MLFILIRFSARETKPDVKQQYRSNRILLWYWQSSRSFSLLVLFISYNGTTSLLTRMPASGGLDTI
jgi:hypothetical protein